MSTPKKIVTCCYCGARAALVLKGKTRHELSCAQCGAPLHELKMIPKSAKGDRELVYAARPAAAPVRRKTSKSKKGKRRKGLLRKVMEEAFDLIEDVFD